MSESSSISSVQSVPGFFQRKRYIDYKSYLKLKEAERKAVTLYQSATKIQSAWRGYLVRSNMQTLVCAVVKIQAFCRHLIAKKYVKYLKQGKVKERLEGKKAYAATKIQSYYRGYKSRKKKFDFMKYKQIKEKNQRLKESISEINELEETLVHASSMTSSTYYDISSDKSEEINDEKVKKNLEMYQHSKCLANLVKKLSTERVQEMQIYADNLRSFTTMPTSKCRRKIRGKLSQSSKQTKRGSGSSSVRSGSLKQGQGSSKSKTSVDEGYLQMKDDLENFEQELSLQNSLEYDASEQTDVFDLLSHDEDSLKDLQGEEISPKASVDSVDKMFPKVPSIDDVIKPDELKVENLKNAIRNLRYKLRLGECEDLLRKHHLLRTAAIPGVYSDIYCDELTPIEKKLKSMRFYQPHVENVYRKSKVMKPSNHICKKSKFKETVLSNNCDPPFEIHLSDIQQEIEKAKQQDGDIERFSSANSVEINEPIHDANDSFQNEIYINDTE